MNRLREFRFSKRISQFRLGLEAGIHGSKISLIENELVKPRPDEVLRISKALGVKSEELFPSD